MTPADIDERIARVRAGANDLGRLFDLPADGITSSGEILLRANETLTQLGLRAAQETAALQDRNRRPRHHRAPSLSLTEIGGAGPELL